MSGPTDSAERAGPGELHPLVVKGLQRLVAVVERRDSAAEASLQLNLADGVVGLLQQLLCLVRIAPELLDRHELLRVGAAGLAERHRREVFLPAAEVAVHLQLDGSPWQSQPGWYGASWPAMRRVRTTRSFRILLSAVPRWRWPLAYGGPSCSTNSGAPARASRTRA